MAIGTFPGSILHMASLEQLQAMANQSALRGLQAASGTYLGSQWGPLSNTVTQEPNVEPKVAAHGGRFIDHLRKEIQDWHGDWTL